MRLLVLSVILTIVGLTLSIQLKPSKCGYASCPATDPKKINVHLIPHTHDDVGWLKTVDEYFYGSKRQYQLAGVQYILDTVITELLNDPAKRFIYVEIAFFWKWWQQLDPKDKTMANVHRLIENGQLEFINAGWAMNDEGATHYQSTIDQMTWGLKQIRETFGKCAVPKIGWHIDPFGHSREQANIFAQMGFDAFFISRLDFADLQLRIDNKTLEFVWHGSDDIGPNSDIFTGIIGMGFNRIGYSPPPGFCFDVLCNDDPFIDDLESEDYNVPTKINAFLDFVTEMSSKYTTNHILIPMGSDFQYMNAKRWYKEMDKLIRYTNQAQDKFNLLYSTPSCYLKSVHQQNQTYTSTSFDFMPYAYDNHSYFGGYLSSRPALKRYERVGNNQMQVCKQLSALTRLGEPGNLNLTLVREAMGVLQHHDAVSGTEKQHVTYDYALRLSKGLDKCKNVINSAYGRMMPIEVKNPAKKQLFCEKLNISSCDVTETMDKVAVTAFNAIGNRITTKIRLPIVGGDYKVYDGKGKIMSSSKVPISAAVLHIPGRNSSAKEELVVDVELPALGYATFFVEKQKSDPRKEESQSFDMKKLKDDQEVFGKGFSILLTADGRIKTVKVNGKSINLNQSFMYYPAMAGDSKTPDRRASGAYVFRPNGTEPIPVGSNGLVSKVIKYGKSTEIHQRWSDWTSQVIRIDENDEFIEFDWVVGPVPVTDNIGKEVIIKFDTDLSTSGQFMTDSNSRQMMTRLRNKRPTFNYTITEPVAGNYYPVNSRIAIRDQQKNIQMTVLNDRSQGGGSLKDGSVELLIHRRLLYDDSFGVGEPLNEPGVDNKGLVIRGRHWLVVSDLESAASLHREKARRVLLEPVVSFAGYDDIDDYVAKYQTNYSLLMNKLPKNVHLLTMEPWDHRWLVRLEHFYQTGEDSILSKPAIVDLTSMFSFTDIIETVEMSLAANQELSEVKRLKFKTFDRVEGGGDVREGNNSSMSGQILLNPMQIRTFLAKFR